jgi:hypothetical protein
MLTHEQVNSRASACVRCGGSFKGAGPLDSALRPKLVGLLLAGDSIGCIEAIRSGTGAAARDAKGTYQHLTRTAGRCHWCDATIPLAEYTDCDQCRSLNIDVQGVQDDV